MKAMEFLQSVLNDLNKEYGLNLNVVETLKDKGGHVAAGDKPISECMYWKMLKVWIAGFKRGIEEGNI